MIVIVSSATSSEKVTEKQSAASKIFIPLHVFISKGLELDRKAFPMRMRGCFFFVGERKFSLPLCGKSFLHSSWFFPACIRAGGVFVPILRFSRKSLSLHRISYYHSYSYLGCAAPKPPFQGCFFCGFSLS